MTDTWIKICGLTNAASVEAALEAGADALGFVFAPSKRRLAPALARQLSDPARGRALRVAVMLHPTAAEWREVYADFAPDVLQTDAADFQSLDVPQEVTRLPVYRQAPSPAAELPGGDSWLLYEGSVSGSGRLADWSQARRLASRRRLVLAGGLDADNVSAALTATRAYGVDVSSGVESAPGVKDPQRIACFVRAVREYEETQCS